VLSPPCSGDVEISPEVDPAVSRIEFLVVLEKRETSHVTNGGGIAIGSHSLVWNIGTSESS
jgi:hypothetical protein